MSGIAGFSGFKQDYTKEYSKWIGIAEDMGKTLSHRGLDGSGTYACNHAAFAHTRLAVRDLPRGIQPMTRMHEGVDYTICYDGELFNTEELKEDLLSKGYPITTTSDTEILLYCYIHYGNACAEKLNGTYAFTVYNSKERCLFLCRDHFGVKPLFYTIIDGTLVFASEIKGLFKFPGVSPKVDKEGLAEIFAIGPARAEGFGIYKDVSEVLPGTFVIWDEYGLRRYPYWKPESKPHTDSYEQTVEKITYLVHDSIKRQLVSDVPVCAFLSGGLDSSVITAVTANHLKEQGRQLDTYSFDYVENDVHFKSNDYQPESDRPWAIKVSQLFDTKHHFLECGIETLVDNLYEAVKLKDIPGMTDIDSSLLYFCGEVKRDFKVALSGECSDEIFGGYPWFHSQEAFDTATFPWSRSIDTRKLLLKQDVIDELRVDDHIDMRYFDSIAEAPKLKGEKDEESRRREIAYLNIKWFMSTLIERQDRMSMGRGLEIRAPFADRRLVEYVFNVPWKMKCRGGITKNLLREAAKDLLPHDLLYRRKSPFPKTYHPQYEKMVADRLREVLNDTSSKILDFIDKDMALKFIETPSDYGKPWFGQLMAGPQMMAYMLQINYWLSEYKVEIV